MQFIKIQKSSGEMIFFTLHFLSLIVPTSQNMPFCLYHVIIKFIVTPYSLALYFMHWNYTSEKSTPSSSRSEHLMPH